MKENNQKEEFQKEKAAPKGTLVLKQEEKETFGKNQIITLVVLLVLLIGVVVSFAFNTQIFGAESVFNQSISDNQIVDKMFHKIPAVIKTFQIIIVCICLFKLIKIVMHKGFGRTNKQITIIKLFISFLRWIIVIVALLLILSAWGVDTTTLLASAGILALIIGLGAQSLIADIIAGFFIVFEEEYQVGDIITIDGFRGTVSDIGIRVTKIIDAGGNIKIVNNSDIKSIINQTSELSVAKCIMSIDYDESVERVEVVFKKSIDKIRKNIPNIIEGPTYKGINQLNTSSVDLFFIAKCKEEDVYQVQRDLNRELYLMFKDNNITVPFTQVVVSNREEEKKEVSAELKNEAKQFVDLQKGITPQDKKDKK